jgi:hypothetical protein
MSLAHDLKCPSCSSPLRTQVRVCDPCGVRIEGHFESPANEFARLSAEELHLLRIFVHTEGSIREMESALGISYPTVKARLGALREKLGMPKGGAEPAGPKAEVASAGSDARTAGGDIELQVAAVLTDMKSGRLPAADAARLIRELRSQVR